MSLQDKVIIITGASAGIGRDLAARLAKEKARIVLAARSEDRLQQLSTELSEGGTDVLVVRTDVSDPNDLSALVEQTIERFQRIDVLINNAGVECFCHFEHVATDEILQTIETNLTGAIVLSRLVVPHMLQQGSGAIINMASTAGKHCPPFGSVYGATKAGLIGFTQGLRGEYLDRGITATAICPGFTKNGGIYDRIVQATGKKTSLALGGTSTKAVANAVLKAIQTGPPELIVNWPPVRPAMVLREIFPRIGEVLTTAVSRRFLRKAAEMSAHKTDGAHSENSDPSTA
ncbi:MAG: SDR family NAD(P)-dependent oxidoreductase [Fuerstiella sp.]|nr:SDR family NAD(P)-dependent oxidoreductase [Fuerstiella sp.]MCP4858586.1 SDR family NAD(P)-dependent oxidoreductase [Fuerstiella sp.]